MRLVNEMLAAQSAKVSLVEASEMQQHPQQWGMLHQQGMPKQQDMQYQQIPTQGYQMPIQQLSRRAIHAPAVLWYVVRRSHAWQTSSMQYGDYGAAMPLHATLHAAPIFYTTAAQRQEYNYWSLHSSSSSGRRSKILPNSSASTSSRLLPFSSLIPLLHDPPAAPFIPTLHGGVMSLMHCSMDGAGGRGAKGGGEGGGMCDLHVAAEGHTGGREGGRDSHAGKTENIGAHGDQRGNPGRPLLQEQQPSLQPQPQLQQLFDDYAQLSVAMHTSQADAEEGGMKVAQQQYSSMPLQQQRYSEACRGWRE